jgi:Zn-dependent oligopeptidase
MPKNAKTVWDFEKSLNEAIRAKTDIELQELLDIKSEFTDKTATEINYWELHYYTNLLQEAKYQLDSEEVSEYFELNNVRKGLFDISQSVFGLSYKQVENPSVWHPDVELYEVYDSETEELKRQKNTRWLSKTNCLFSL